MKRILAALLVFIMILSALAPVVFADSPNQSSGEILAELGVLAGDEDGNLMLNNYLRRQDMVVMISRLYNQEETAKNFRGTNPFKDLTQDRRFYIPYITWARSEGLIQGMEKDEFGFNVDVTVQQYQTVLLRALGYGEEASNWDSVPELARSLGLMKNLNLTPSSRLTRGQMAEMTLNALRESRKGSTQLLGNYLNLDVPPSFNVVSKAEVNVNNVSFQGNLEGGNKLTLNVRTTSSGNNFGDQKFEIQLNSDNSFIHELKGLPQGSYEYRFQSGSLNTAFKSFEVKNVPFDIIDISANNLKEIHVSFTKPVDTKTSAFVNNYTTNAGTIRNVRFEDNNQKIVLTLNGLMRNQEDYSLSSAAIRSNIGETLTLNKEDFMALDLDPPKVLEVSALGNKGVKILLSEPVKTVSQGNFKIDGRMFSGNVKYEDNIVTLLNYSNTTFSEGSHTITISGLEDFAGFRLNESEFKFSVVKDTSPPKLIDARATLEEIVLEFDKDINYNTINRTNFHWRTGSIKRYPDSINIIGNKAYLDYGRNRLSGIETTVYVENIEDYWGNKLSSSQIKVTPSIDTTSPEVLNYNVAEDGRSISVYFSKNVNGTSRDAYRLTDKDGKTIFIRNVEGSSREFKVNLSQPLPVGENTLEISGITDTTPLQNLSIPFTTKINMEDVVKPEVKNYTAHGNYIMIEFTKSMDTQELANYDNYYIEFDGSIRRLPVDSSINPGAENKSVTILLPDRIDNKKVSAGENLTKLDVRGLKDLAGNDTSPVVLSLKFDSSTSANARATEAILVEANVLRVNFNIPIIQGAARDFTVSGRTIEAVYIDGSSQVTIHLNDTESTSIPSNGFRINSDNNMRTYIDSPVEGGVVAVKDEVSPRIKDSVTNLYSSNGIIELPFTEVLEDEGSSLYRRDLEIIREADGKVLSADDFTTSLKASDKSVLLITIRDRSLSSKYSLRLKGEGSNQNPTYIRDASGNIVEPNNNYFTTRSNL